VLAHPATATFAPKAELARSAELRSMRDFAGADPDPSCNYQPGNRDQDTANGTRWSLADNAVAED
jgi:hypothetical protein